MKIYTTVPRDVIDEWVASVERHEPGERFPFHYHDVEEWLQVQEGRIGFHASGGQPHWVETGQAFRIPRGEVHRVEVAGGGVQYRMWIAAAVPDSSFANRLEAEDLALIEKNLAFPRAEDSGDVAFFQELLSERLTFRAATGDVLDKSAFMNRGFTNRLRGSSGSVCILHKTPASVLLSTTVSVPDANGPRSYMNERLFAREDGVLMCRAWLNYPQ